MLLLLALAQAAAVNGPAPVPPSEWPDYVRVASRAIAAKDVMAIADYLDLVEIPADGSGGRLIRPADVLTALDGCRQLRVMRSAETRYRIEYSCPSHPKTGCDTGDIFVMVAKEPWKRTLGLLHERKASAACPVFIAPPLPPSRRPPQ